MARRFRPELDGTMNAGWPDIRWASLFFTYLEVSAKYPLSISNIATKSAALGIVDIPDPDQSGLYLVVIRGKWRAVRVDRKPPDAADLDGGMLLKVENGDWAAVYQPYSLPYAYPELGWLSVVDGKWGSREMDLTPLPVVTDYDDGMVLAVVDGEWNKADADNFYLPSVTPITPEVPHVVQVVGQKWLIRPLDEVKPQSKGFVPVVPGDPGLVFHGDGQWRGSFGRDTGRYRIGDFRRAGARGDSIWLAADGSTVGRTGADYSGVDYYDIYIFLGGTMERWDAGELINLPTVPDHEILIYDRMPNPVALHLITGDVADAPFEVQVSATPDFSKIFFESRSDREPDRWETHDTTVMCNLAGMVNETYARFAEPFVAAAVMDAGFFYVRWRKVGAQLWNHDEAWITEEDILRLDTILTTGVSTSGIFVRSPSFRQQLLSINGRALRGELYKTTTTIHGTSLARNTAGYIPYNKDDDQRDTAEALQGLEITVYGTGDGVADTIQADPTMVKLMNQLKDLDGYTTGRKPKFRLIEIKFGGERKKWWGGNVGADGNIYFVPHFAETVLVAEPKTGRTRKWGSFGSNMGKWAGGVSAPDNKIYCMPYANSRFLVLDPLKQKGDMTSLDAPMLRQGCWVGGCLTTDNRIISPSLFGHQELEINLTTGKAWQYDLYTAMRKVANKAMPWFTDKDEHPFRWYTPTKSYMSTAIPTCITQSSGLGWYSMCAGAVMGADGRVRSVPSGDWHIEIARPGGSAYEEDDGVPTDRDMFYWAYFGRQWKNPEEPLASNTATMGSTMMRFLNYEWKDRSNKGLPHNYQGIKDKSYYEHLLHKRMMFMGGILAPDGNNYFLPCSGDSSEVLVAAPSIPPYNDLNVPMSAFNVSDPRFKNCRGGCLGPDGNIYASSADGTAVFIITPRTREVVTLEIPHTKLHRRYSAWMGAVVGPDGYIYFPPFDSKYLLVVDPCVAANPWSAELNQYINKF